MRSLRLSIQSFSSLRMKIYNLNVCYEVCKQYMYLNDQQTTLDLVLNFIKKVG